MIIVAPCRLAAIVAVVCVASIGPAYPSDADAVSLRACAANAANQGVNYPAGCWDTFPRGIERVYIAAWGIPMGSSWDAELTDSQGQVVARVHSGVYRAPSVVSFSARALPLGRYTVRATAQGGAPLGEVSFDIVPPPDPAGPPTVAIDAPTRTREGMLYPIVARTTPGATCAGNGSSVSSSPLVSYPIESRIADSAGIVIWTFRAAQFSSSTTLTIWCFTPQGRASATMTRMVVP